MRRFNLFLTFLALGATLAFGQSKKEAAVATAVDQLTSALLSGDRASLTAIAKPVIFECIFNHFQ